jgi:transcriptional regulator with XRE-family HTH domain
MEKKFTARLRELRGFVNQTTFARKFGVKQTTYSCWELGTREPPITMLTKIISDSNISADWLLGLSDDRNGKISTMPNPTLTAKIAELESEITRLKGENAGLRHALEVVTHTSK